MIPKDAIIDVVNAEYVDGYRLKIDFSDGFSQVVDFGKFLKKSAHPDINKYLDLDMFKQFRIVCGRLDWNDYELCFSLEDLYSNTIIK